MNLMKYFTFRSNFFLVLWFIVGASICIVFLNHYGWGKYFGIIGLLGFIYPIYNAIQANLLQKHLKSLGYDWISFGNCYRISTALHSRAWSIPAHDEAASLPDYTDDPTGLIRIVNQGQGKKDYKSYRAHQTISPKIKKYLSEHEKLPQPPPASHFQILITDTYSKIFYSLFSCFFSTLLIFGNILDNALLLIIGLSFLLFPLPYIYDLLIPYLIRKRLSRLGYEKPDKDQALKMQEALKEYIWKIPERKELERILETEYPIEYGDLISCMYTYKVHQESLQHTES